MTRFRTWPARMGKGILGAEDRGEALRLLGEGRAVLLWSLLSGVAIHQVLGARLGWPRATEAQLVLNYAYLTCAFAFTLLSAVWGGDWARNRHGGWIPLAFDGLSLSSWIHLSGGKQTPLALVYLSLILIAGLLYFRNGAVLAAAVASLLFAALTLSGSSFPHPVLGWLAFTAMFLSVGVVGGYLSEELRRTTTSLRLKQSQIRKITELHEGILQGLPTGLLTVDSQLQIHFINPAGAHILGRSAASLVGQPLADVADMLLPFLSQIDSEEIDAEIQPPGGRAEAMGSPETRLATASQPSATPGTRRSYFAHPTHGSPATRLQQQVTWGEGAQRRVLRGDVAELGAEAGVGSLLEREQAGAKVLLFQDVTRLVGLEDKLRQHEKLAAVGRLAAGIAHEIRNPLASMSASIEMLKDTLPPGLLHSSENHKLMEIAVREIDRLNRLISEFLDFVKPDSIKMERVELASLLSEVVIAARGLKEFKSHIQLKETFAAGACAWGSPEKLKQVVWNLLVNALQAVEPQAARGSSTTAGDRPAVARPVVELGCAVVAPGQVKFWVSDTGQGMTETVQQHLFEPFFTTKERGTGLGLATAFKIVEAHRGEIRVTSKPEAGTCFEVVLESA